jgi:hypothetical protein
MTLPFRIVSGLFIPAAFLFSGCLRDTGKDGSEQAIETTDLKVSIVVQKEGADLSGAVALNDALLRVVCSSSGATLSRTVLFSQISTIKLSRGTTCATIPLSVTVDGVTMGFYDFHTDAFEDPVVAPTGTHGDAFSSSFPSDAWVLSSSSGSIAGGEDKPNIFRAKDSASKSHAMAKRTTDVGQVPTDNTDATPVSFVVAVAGHSNPVVKTDKDANAPSYAGDLSVISMPAFELSSLSYQAVVLDGASQIMPGHMLVGLSLVCASGFSPVTGGTENARETASCARLSNPSETQALSSLSFAFVSENAWAILEEVEFNVSPQLVFGVVEYTFNSLLSTAFNFNPYSFVHSSIPYRHAHTKRTSSSFSGDGFRFTLGQDDDPLPFSFNGATSSWSTQAYITLRDTDDATLLDYEDIGGLSIHRSELVDSETYESFTFQKINDPVQ